MYVTNPNDVHFSFHFIQVRIDMYGKKYFSSYQKTYLIAFFLERGRPISCRFLSANQKSCLFFLSLYKELKL